MEKRLSSSLSSVPEEKTRFENLSHTKLFPTMRGKKRSMRGSGHKFSRNLKPLQFDEDGNLIPDENEVSVVDKKKKSRRPTDGDGDEEESGSESGSEDEDSDEEESGSESGSEEEESSDEEEGSKAKGAKPAAKPAAGTAAVVEVSNPNRAKKGTVKLSDLGKTTGGGGAGDDDDLFRRDGQMSRRERWGLIPS